MQVPMLEDFVMVDFYEEYDPPPPPKPGQKRTPEEIEAELKKQEEELQRLALVTIKLPDTVFWFEPPIMVRWDDEESYWTTEGFYDLKFNEDKQQLTFRTGEMGLMALAAFRFPNLPYQTWELRPVPEGGVVLSITAAILIVEFFINKQGQICLQQLQNGPNNTLQDIVGNFYKPHQLIRIMREGGADIFPSYDAFCYVEGATGKNYVAEIHLYRCMAMFAQTYNFSWSRWNLLAGKDNMVLQIREFVETDKVVNYSMLLVTPYKAAIVDCSEMSQSFSETEVPEMKYYSDLYFMIMDMGSETSKSMMEEMGCEMLECLSDILISTKVLSFS